MSPISSAHLTKFLLLATAMVCVASTPALAQTPDSPSESEARWSISIGADPFEPSIGSTSQNFVAALGREWNKKGSKLGYRSQLTVGAEPTTNLFFRQASCPDCFVSRQQSFAELSGVATYTFRKNRKVQPYLLGGPALYAVRSRYAASGVTFGGQDQNPAETNWSLGATFGIGTRFKLFGTYFSIEQRFIAPELTTRSRQDHMVRPFTLGISF